MTDQTKGADSGAASPCRHTPGPWQIARDTRPDMEWNNHIVGADPNMTVCFMAHDNTDANLEGEANAALIAAAPDMLAALKNAEIFLRVGATYATNEAAAETIDATGERLVIRGLRDTMTATADRVKAAIAKAEGTDAAD